MPAGAEQCHRTRSSGMTIGKLRDRGASGQSRGWRWASLRPLACFPCDGGSLGSSVLPGTGCLPASIQPSLGWIGLGIWWGDHPFSPGLPGAVGERMSCSGAVLEGRDEEGKEEGEQQPMGGSLVAETAWRGSPMPRGSQAPHRCPLAGTALPRSQTPGDLAPAAPRAAGAGPPGSRRG